MTEDERAIAAITQMSRAEHWILLSVKDLGELHVCESMEGVSVALIAALITNLPGYEEKLAKAVEHMRIPLNNTKPN